MKNVTEFVFLTVLTVIFKIFHMNYVTADLIPVDENCENQIELLFEKSDNDCVTVEEQIEHIFLKVVTDDLNSPEKRIVQEYTKHLYKAVEMTLRRPTPAAFCRAFVQTNNLGDDVNHCLLQLQKYGGILYTIRGRSIVENIYYHHALTKYTEYYLEHFIRFVQKSYDVDKNKLYGVTTSKLFCKMRECYYQIGSDISNITEMNLKSFEFIKFALHHADYREFHYENSKNYMNYIFNAIDLDITVQRMQTPKEFCNSTYSTHWKLCYKTIKKHNWNRLMTKEGYLAYIFYCLNKNNTSTVEIEGTTINFTHHYMTNVSNNLFFKGYGQRLQRRQFYQSITRPSPTDFCSSVVRVH